MLAKNLCDRIKKNGVEFIISSLLYIAVSLYLIFEYGIGFYFTALLVLFFAAIVPLLLLLRKYLVYVFLFILCSYALYVLDIGKILFLVLPFHIMSLAVLLIRVRQANGEKRDRHN